MLTPTYANQQGIWLTHRLLQEHRNIFRSVLPICVKRNHPDGALRQRMLKPAPQAAGLLAVSLGYSRMYRDDLAQLDAAMGLYDALYRWCRDATDEGHNWPSATVRGNAR